MVQEQLKKIGIDVQLYPGDVAAQKAAQTDIDKIQLNVTMVGRADYDVIKSQYYSGNRNQLLNMTGDESIGDEHLEELLRKVSSSATSEDRADASGDVQDYLSEQAYVLPMFEEPAGLRRAVLCPRVPRRVDRPTLVLPHQCGRGGVDDHHDSPPPHRRGGPGRSGPASPSPSSCSPPFPGTPSPPATPTPNSVSQPPRSPTCSRPTVPMNPSRPATWNSLTGVLHLDFGNSLQTGADVMDSLTDALPGTHRPQLTGFLVALVIAVLVAVTATSLPDNRVCRWISTTLRASAAVRLPAGVLARHVSSSCSASPWSGSR